MIFWEECKLKLRKILCLIMAMTVSCGAFSALPAGAVDVISDIASEASIEEVYFDWDKSSDEGISFDTGSLSKNVVLKRNGIIVASSLLSRNLSINDGQVSIGAGILGKFSEGEHTFSVILSDGIFDLTVNITDNEREITAEKTDFEWDRSSLLGITVNTDSKSKKVVVLKDDMIISEGLLDAGIILGKVTISKNVLGKLDDGENKLQLVLDDGLIDVNVNVTNENAEKYVTAKTDYFEWDKSNILGISVDTNSRSKNVSLYKADPEVAGKLKVNGKYLICGEGESKSALTKLIIDSGLQDCVRLLGYRNDIPDICCISDIFVFPSYREGLPIALMEAMATGLPAVASEIRGNVDLIENGVNGYLVNMNNPSDWRSRIQELMSDGGLRKSMHDANKVKMQKYDKLKTKEELRKIYEELNLI